jgi:hypothetical protein
VNIGRTLRNGFLLTLDCAQLRRFIVTAVTWPGEGDDMANRAAAEGGAMKVRLAAVLAAATATLLSAGCSSGPAVSGASGPGAGVSIPLLTEGEVNSYSNLDPDQTQGCNNNFCGLFMEHGLATSSPAKRLSIYRQVLADVATDEPYVVLFNLNAYTALSSGYTLPPFAVYPAFTSWALHIKLTG